MIKYYTTTVIGGGGMKEHLWTVLSVRIIVEVKLNYCYGFSHCCALISLSRPKDTLSWRTISYPLWPLNSESIVDNEAAERTHTKETHLITVPSIAVILWLRTGTKLVLSLWSEAAETHSPRSSYPDPSPCAHLRLGRSWSQRAVCPHFETAKDRERYFNEDEVG